MSRRQVTLIDVAAAAGTSLATASRVLNGSARRVSEALRERVVESARSLGYVPDASAQTLARSSSPLVGLIVQDIADPYFSSIAAGVMPAAEERHLVVRAGTTGRDPDRELDLLSTLRSHRARAVVLAGSRTTDKEQTKALAAEIDRFTGHGGRAVCVSQARLPTDTVVPANRTGSRDLARALVGLGHTRFAVLAGPTDVLSARDRLAGFRAGLAESGLTVEPADVVHGAFTRDGGYDAVRELVARGSSATCVFAVNDVMATGALAGLRAEGRAVPDDVSLAGFDDIPTVHDLSPTLSTVMLPLVRMGEIAAEMALDDADRSSPRTVRVAGQVVLRESTAPPPG